MKRRQFLSVIVISILLLFCILLTGCSGKQQAAGSGATDKEHEATDIIEENGSTDISEDTSNVEETDEIPGEGIDISE